MAPTNPPKPVAPQKPVALGPAPKARQVLPRHAHAQRSSLRLAIQESLRDVTALTSPSPTLTSPSNSTSTPASASSIPPTPAITPLTSTTPPSSTSPLPAATTTPDRHGHAAATEEVDTNGIPTSRKNWHPLRSIIAETLNQNGRISYLVDWEGQDPRTGVSWPSSWVDAKNVSAAAVRAWKKSQDSKAAS
ncbi:hypothetical protein F5Y13DRAFT_167494 [Hypoxylon sp. FL1857]|nr:hypothetical protein F5Y13DRAFT_167494 [Hypoxylon sp. FL1857]